MKRGTEMWMPVSRSSQGCWGGVSVAAWGGGGHRAEAIPQRRDDAAAIGVILRVGGEYHADIEIEADGITTDLDVAFFEDVEEADLNFGGQVGQFIDGKDAAV